MSRIADAELGCKCAACLKSEEARSAQDPPYRFEPGPGHTFFHLALHASLPITGMVLIGLSWWALAPSLGFLAAYLANSLILCPTCAYHHAGVRFCGCYPKSVFPYRLYLEKRWGLRENIFGRSSVIILTIGPSIAVLAAKGAGPGIVVLLFQTVAVLFLTSVVSCPDCRQRDVCMLGRLTIAGLHRDLNEHPH
jgi:hypothetical protein